MDKKLLIVFDDAYDTYHPFWDSDGKEIYCDNIEEAKVILDKLQYNWKDQNCVNQYFLGTKKEIINYQYEPEESIEA